MAFPIRAQRSTRIVGNGENLDVAKIFFSTIN